MQLDKLFTQEAINQIPGFVTIHGIDSTIVLTDDDSAHLMGYSYGRQLEGKNYFDMRCRAVEDADNFLLQDKQVLDSRKPLSFLSYHCYAGNEWKVILGTKKPLFVSKEMMGFISCWQDVTNYRLIDLGRFLLANGGKRNKQQQIAFSLSKHEPKDKLTNRELECLFYLIRGGTGKKIAKALNISQRTVEAHIEHIKTKLHCTTKAEAIEKAIAKGYMTILPESLFNKTLLSI